MENGKKEFLEFIKVNNYILLTDYKDARTEVLIDYRCGHEPHWIRPINLKNVNRNGPRGCPKCGIEKMKEKIEKKTL